MTNLANHLQFAKLKPLEVVGTINKPLADPFICQTFFCQTLEKDTLSAKLSCYTVVLTLTCICSYAILQMLTKQTLHY